MSDKQAETAAPTMDSCWPWDRLPGTTALRGWAEEIGRNCREERGIDHWRLTGKAVVIVNDDMNYVREVMRTVAKTAGIQLSVIPVSEVLDLPKPSGLRSLAPVLVYLESERWMQSEPNEDEDPEYTSRVRQFQADLSAWLRDFNPGHPVLFAVAAYKLDDVAAPLRRVGGFDRFFALPAQSLEFLGEQFLGEVGHEHCGASLMDSAAKIGKLLKSNFAEPEQQALAVLALQRLAVREDRQLEFTDLVHLSSHDLLEEDDDKRRKQEESRQIAYHEAGHAVLSILESDGGNIPDYTSIVPGASGFGGITVESYGYHLNKGEALRSYDDFRHQIRISLGGRAAEEIAYGAGQVGNGASGDLNSASSMAWDAFARWGFAPSQERPGQSGSNLQVILGKPYEAEYLRITALVRQFLEEEYRAVTELLQQHRPLLDLVTERLLWDPVVDQAEMAEMYQKYLEERPA